MVLYFSGTGNSEHVAKRVADALDDALYSINGGIKKSSYPDVADAVVIFAVPTYAWRIPRIVTKWIQDGFMFSGRKAYFLLTCGGGIGNAERYVRDLCTDRGMTFMGCAEILMPENYIARYDCPSEDESRKIVRAADKKVGEIAAMIKSGDVLPAEDVSASDSIKSSIVNDVFYPLCVGSKKFFAKDACIGCGKCASLCPLNNIRLQDGHPVWGNNCPHCMACICHCPAEAIEYGRISVGKRRYRCPE